MVITLTTDFGYRDVFAGVMKGVILNINPAARLVDLTHGIAPQDIFAAALTVRHAVGYFPPGTIHVVVVDPGVGTERRPLLIQLEDYCLIGPDNGVLSLALPAGAPWRAVELSNPAYRLEPTSSTFHGRDIFAPAAAHRSLDIPVEAFGPPVRNIARLPFPAAQKSPERIVGAIVYIDGFGNLFTNIEARDLAGLPRDRLTVAGSGLRIRGLSENYSGKPGACVALINSWGLLEIAASRASAQEKSGAKVGDPVEIILRPEK